METSPAEKQTKRTKIELSVSKYKRQFLSRHLRVARGVLLGTATLLILGIFVAFRTMWNGSSLQYYAGLAHAFAFPNKYINSSEPRYNVLILGEGGEGHESPDLTDTILVASVRLEFPHSIDLISIPRDIWVPEFGDKINAAYKKGSDKYLGAGFVLAKSSVEDVIGIPVSSSLVIDFSGFREFIDFVGGVDIEVKRTFTDERYPIAGRENDNCGGDDPEYLCRYETVTFTKGIVHMDGETALKFARSRHSEDLEEGTDLARAARQQQILAALKDKVLSRDTLTSPSRLLSLWKLVLKYVKKDMSDQEFVALGRIMYENRGSITSQVLPENLLENPPLKPEYNNLYVFLPQGGDWGAVHDWVASVLGI